ncbi:CYTH domain-containing protein [archaeon]|jgi:predicted adenylyl cyclase CyaB|nr:CYTH domain-containing protein [archaeon]MBT3450391.1 CYTH domain-containing protein [archaeon]MBT6868631.1 CYTH domain-containing protein [archaeon]MBT7381428.1 CYTH domain-containing protein [archaeon]MBT7508061.1 CYTH domain-containing protein [archaeon]
MEEIEVKILNIEPKKVIYKIKKLGAKKISQGLVHSKGYDFPRKVLRKKSQYVRVRKINDKIEVVFKGLKKGKYFDINEEIEYLSSNFEKACLIFERLGMKKFADMEKYRVTYKLNNSKIEFDKYPTVPWFIEVESPTEKEVKEIVKLLNFDFNDKKKVTTKLINQVYGDQVHFTNFKEKEEYNQYLHLFD